jgi:peptide/nickel transport system ATP-binding protein
MTQGFYLINKSGLHRFTAVVSYFFYEQQFSVNFKKALYSQQIAFIIQLKQIPYIKMAFHMLGRMMRMSAVLEVKQLKTAFNKNRRETVVLNGVDFHINRGETLGIVGESGCGKSVTALSVMGLLPNIASITGGSIRLNGTDILQLSKDKRRKLRGKEMAMIFQEPMTSLNPVYTIGQQIIEMVRSHRNVSKKEARKHAIHMLQLVGIPRAEEIVDEYPHQLSGGMRQRVMIALAMSCEPDLLIADEPTTALDVTIQAQILELMKDLQQKKDTSIMLITHDLGVVAEMCDRVIVMYAGEVVEESEVNELFEQPKHPYSRGLIRSIPKMEEEKEYLYSIPGTVPTAEHMPKGCRFAERCPEAFERCFQQAPPLITLNDKSKSRCWLHDAEATDGERG